jgi:hypothetical protein
LQFGLYRLQKKTMNNISTQKKVSHQDSRTCQKEKRNSHEERNYMARSHTAKLVGRDLPNSKLIVRVSQDSRVDFCISSSADPSKFQPQPRTDTCVGDS